MRLLLAFTTVAALIFGAVASIEAGRAADNAEATGLAPKRLVIGLDISLSNPLIADRAFASKVGARIASMVEDMSLASEVHVRTFGTYDASQNAFYYDTVLSIRSRPERVAREIEKLIAAVPDLIAHGRFHPQKRTNILGFLDNVRESVGCGGMPTTIVLASDGIEDSEYADLDRRNDHLPSPKGKPFSRCASFQILGVGQGTHSPKKTERLRSEWERWSAQAGFANFSGLNDW